MGKTVVMPSHYWITSVLGQSRSLEHVQRSPMRHHTFEHPVYTNLCKENEKKGRFSIIESLSPCSDGISVYGYPSRRSYSQFLSSRNGFNVLRLGFHFLVINKNTLEQTLREQKI